jgi:hypothetical protein
MESPTRSDNPSPTMEMFEEHQPEPLLDVDDPNLPLPPLRRSVTHHVLPKKRAVEDLTVADIEDDDELDIPDTAGNPDLYNEAKTWIIEHSHLFYSSVSDLLNIFSS